MTAMRLVAALHEKDRPTKPDQVLVAQTCDIPSSRLLRTEIEQKHPHQVGAGLNCPRPLFLLSVTGGRIGVGGQSTEKIEEFL